MTLDITKGKWSVQDGDDRGAFGQKGFAIYYGDNEEQVVDYVYEHDDAILIADAGNTYQECGLTPSELLEQRDELLEALELADLAFSGKNMNMAIIERKIKAALLKARNANGE